MNDTICALSTPGGIGAVAVVRISGPGAAAAVNSLLLKPLKEEHGRVALRKIYDGQSILDKALLTYFKSPSSFTGEDVVEIALHGSPYIKGRILELLSVAGARPARAGEFSCRAFLNGKMDLVESQALCDLIESDNASAHALAMNNLEGHLSRKYQKIKLSLSELLAQIEVRLDDADGEMEPLAESFVFAELAKVQEELSFLIQSYSTGRLVKEGIKVCISGVPNAGKSSLLNALLGYDRAIVSEEHGTTRDTVEDALAHNGHKIVFIDTAGIREGVSAAEREGIRRSLKAMENAEIVLFVSDASADETQEEKELMRLVQTKNKKIIHVFNKADKLPARSAASGVKVSAVTGAGVDILLDKITEILGAGANQNTLVTSALQYDSLKKCLAETELAKQAYKNGPEFTAEHIRGALTAVKETIGEVLPDDILGIIFSRFCVGK